MMSFFAKSVEYFKPSLKLLQQNAGILIISSIILVAVAAVAAASASAAVLLPLQLLPLLTLILRKYLFCLFMLLFAYWQ